MGDVILESVLKMFGVLVVVMFITRHGSGDHHRMQDSPSKALLAGHSMLLWIMAVPIPFRSKSESSSQCRFVHVIEGLTCPACEYERVPLPTSTRMFSTNTRPLPAGQTIYYSFNDPAV